MINKKGSGERQLNNKGFSLLELLIVIAIMVIAGALVIIGISVLSQGDGKKMSKNLYSSLINLRSSTMSVNADWYMTVEKEDGIYRIRTYKDGEVTQSFSGGSRLDMKYEADGISYDINEGTLLTIKYRKDNGALESVVIDVNGTSDNDTDDIDLLKGTTGVFTITADNTDYLVTMWYKTGRITTEN
ncbi:MAG: Tfp pilus assembly protein FimT/FimU [Lachnospira sp.]